MGWTADDDESEEVEKDELEDVGDFVMEDPSGDEDEDEDDVND